jgi:hypothetical protein
MFTSCIQLDLAMIMVGYQVQLQLPTKERSSATDRGRNATATPKHAQLLQQYMNSTSTDPHQQLLLSQDGMMFSLLWQSCLRGFNAAGQHCAHTVGSAACKGTSSMNRPKQQQHAKASASAACQTKCSSNSTCKAAACTGKAAACKNNSIMQRQQQRANAAAHAVATTHAKAASCKMQ